MFSKYSKKGISVFIKPKISPFTFSTKTKKMNTKEVRKEMQLGSETLVFIFLNYSLMIGFNFILNLISSFESIE